MLKFLVLSDLHLVPEGRLSHGMDTAARLDQAITHIAARHSDAAFCIFAGDLADHGERGAYDRLAAMLTGFPLPCYMTLGNHDDRTAFLDVFGTDLATPTGFLDCVVDAGDYRILILDTLLDGATEGALADSQHDWLAAQLADAAERPVIVVLHHAIADLGVPTDFINLTDKPRLAAALTAHGDVRMVISGHVHMSTAGSYRGIPFTTIAGSHYNIFPQLHGPLDSIPRLEGPGQMGVVLAGPDGVVVHHENFFDRHPQQPPERFAWNRAAD
ncbi:metallophosphoesterase [Actibacterium sp. D379-3]